MMENKITCAETVLITVTSDTAHPGFQKLKQSVEKHNWTFVVLEVEWKGFCTKIISVYEFLKVHPEVKQFFFCDANDVVVFGGMEEALEKVGNNLFLFSAERGCWPLQYLKNLFTEHKGGYNYLNSGCYFANSELFIELVDNFTPQKSDEDQSYCSIMYHMNIIGFEDWKLDNTCSVFQSYSFIQDGDYDYSGERPKNLLMNTIPVFFHGNGRSDMTKIYEMI